MSLAERRGLRLFMLCSLYVAQGIPWGFTSTTLPAYLSDRGLDFALVATTLSFTTLPYTFKWMWGPLIDLVSIPGLGRRRSWILLAQGMMVATIAIMLVVDPTTDIKLLAWMILIHTTFNALQDVAVDALATELLEDDERGRANGLMYGFKYLGGLIGGIGMATVIKYVGFDAALTVQVVMLLAIMCVPFLVRESDQPQEPVRPVSEIAHDLVAAFSLRSTLLAALLVLAATFAIGVVSATGFKLFVYERSFDYFEYTAISGGWGLLVGAVVASGMGFLVDVFGRRRMFAIACGLLAIGWIAFANLEPYWGERWLIYTSALWAELCAATLMVSLIALCMDLTAPLLGGSQFAGYMALSNFSTTLGYQFATTANELWEYRGIYYLAAGWQIAITLLLLGIDRNETRREMPTARVRWFGAAALGVIVLFLIAMTIYVTKQRLG